ncbi:MAG: TonB-dependent receptor [Candidatus Marinimicrobia bacterium]|nr:TonB-dependent receptor [Candidatus Neomarinimicrobiota bacterium]
MNTAYKWNNHNTLFFLIAFCLIGSQFIHAGVITGRVTDGATGDYLPGANITLSGTNYGAASDRTGQFRIANVASGSYTFTVDYIGYEAYSVEITLAEDESIVLNAALNVSYVAMDGIVVEGLRQGLAKALSQQKSSDRIMNIVSAEQIEAFPDPNIAEALQRIPGVSIQRDHGEGRYILIRGTEARLNSTQIDGNSIPSPEDDNRNVSLDVIPSDLMSYIEVTKALTPDMDGDAIGGSVNLITKNAFDFDGRVIKADVSGGYRNLRGDLAQKLTFTYGNQFMGGKLGLLIGGSYNNADMATDDLELEWNDEAEWVTNVLEDDEDEEYKTDAIDAKVLDDMQLRVYDLNRKRVGLNLNLDFKLNDRTSFYIKYLHNTYTDTETRQMLRIRFGKSIDEEEPGTGYTSATHVVGVPIYRELKDRNSVSKIQSISAGGKHIFPKFDLDYNFSTSFAEEVRNPSRDVVFKQKGFDLDFDISDEIYPTFSVTNNPELLNDMSEYEFDEMEYKDGEQTKDKNLTATINIQVPYSFGSAVGAIKFGGKYRDKEKNSDKTNELLYEWDGDDDLMATAYETSIEGGNFMDDHYSSEIGIDPEKFADFWEANKDGDFVKFPGVEANFFETWDATETITAFYGMGTFNFGKMMLLGGARVEMTKTTYNGWVGNLGDLEDEAEEANPDFSSIISKTEDSKEYTTLLPMIHLRYNLNDKTVIRTAFTQSLARPDYINLVPVQMLDDDELFLGNTDLEPTLSTNLDLMIEYYIGSLGIISFGYFSKTLSNYIYMKYTLYDDNPHPDNADIETVIQPVNGEDATLSGFEFSWQQQLTFLPGALQGLGIYLNYTNIQSEAHYIFEEREPTTLPGQAETVGNFALSYESGRFAARLSANFHGKYIFEIGEEPAEDIYYADNTQIDLSASYNLKSNIKLYVDALNITNTPLVYYLGDPEFPIQRELYSYGVRAGVRFDL